MAATRILTTHAGSLPRPPDLSGLMLSRSKGEPVNLDALKKRVAEATREVVRKQAELGIDIVSDGEYGKASYVEYVKDRLRGCDFFNFSSWHLSTEVIHSTAE